MKKLLISALLAVVATTLFSSCTTVPRDNANANVSSTSSSTTYSK